jgi:hypothetical protein
MHRPYDLGTDISVYIHRTIGLYPCHIAESHQPRVRPAVPTDPGKVPSMWLPFTQDSMDRWMNKGFVDSCNHRDMIAFLRGMAYHESAHLLSGEPWVVIEEPSGNVWWSRDAFTKGPSGDRVQHFFLNLVNDVNDFTFVPTKWVISVPYTSFLVESLWYNSPSNDPAEWIDMQEKALIEAKKLWDELCAKPDVDPGPEPTPMTAGVSEIRRFINMYLHFMRNLKIKYTGNAPVRTLPPSDSAHKIFNDKIIPLVKAIRTPACTMDTRAQKCLALRNICREYYATVKTDDDPEFEDLFQDPEATSLPETSPKSDEEPEGEQPVPNFPPGEDPDPLNRTKGSSKEGKFKLNDAEKIPNVDLGIAREIAKTLNARLAARRIQRRPSTSGKGKRISRRRLPDLYTKEDKSRLFTPPFIPDPYTADGHVVAVWDRSGSMGGVPIRNELKAACTLFAGLFFIPKFKVTYIEFGSPAEVIFEDKPNDLKKGIEKISKHLQARGMNDVAHGASIGLDILKDSRAHRKVLIVANDGDLDSMEHDMLDELDRARSLKIPFMILDMNASYPFIQEMGSKLQQKGRGNEIEALKKNIFVINDPHDLLEATQKATLDSM